MCVCCRERDRQTDSHRETIKLTGTEMYSQGRINSHINTNARRKTHI